MKLFAPIAIAVISIAPLFAHDSSEHGHSHTHGAPLRLRAQAKPLPTPSAAPAASSTPPAGNGTLMAASFSPFKPNVRFYNDASYFYVESDSMPDATLMPTPMVGITAFSSAGKLPMVAMASRRVSGVGLGLKTNVPVGKRGSMAR